MKVNVKTIIICLFLLFCIILPTSAVIIYGSDHYALQKNGTLDLSETVTGYMNQNMIIESYTPTIDLIRSVLIINCTLKKYPIQFNLPNVISTSSKAWSAVPPALEAKMVFKESGTTHVMANLTLIAYKQIEPYVNYYGYFTYVNTPYLNTKTGNIQSDLPTIIYDNITNGGASPNLKPAFAGDTINLTKIIDIAGFYWASTGAASTPPQLWVDPSGDYYTVYFLDSLIEYGVTNNPSNYDKVIMINRPNKEQSNLQIYQNLTLQYESESTTENESYLNFPSTHGIFKIWVNATSLSYTIFDDNITEYTSPPTDTFSMIVDKGNTLSTKLLPKELTEAHLIGDISNVKEIRWGWSESLSDNSNLFNWKYQYYRYNNTISSWERYYNRFHNINIENDLPTIVSENEVINREILFNWSDSSTYWNLNLPPNNFVQVTVYDNDNNQLAALIKHLYVGSSLNDAITTIYIYDVRTGTYLSDSKLYIYDESTSNYIINGEEISYKKIIELPYLDDYVIWATHTNFEQSYSKSLGVNFYGKYLNYTPWAYSNTDIQIWMNYIGIGMNRSVVLHIVNEEGLPIETAQCKFDSSQSHDTITSNNYGDCWYQAIDTVNYTYEVSKSSYNTVSGSFLANTTIYKRITLFAYTQPTTATLTPTITSTPTPEEAPADLIGIIFWYLRQLGIELTNAKLLIAGMLILICIIIVGYYTKSGIAALSGGGVGFIISLALGLIPIWVFIAMIVVFGMLLAYRWNAQGG